MVLLRRIGAAVLAVVLCALLVATAGAPASAADAPTFLDRGRLEAVNERDSSQSFTLVTVAKTNPRADCSEVSTDSNYAGDDQACSYTFIGFKAKGDIPPNIVLYYLSTYQNRGRTGSVFSTITPANASTNPGINGSAADFWVSIPTDGAPRWYAGFVCAGINPPGVAYAELKDSGPCHWRSSDPNLAGVPRDEFDMGHKAEAGGKDAAPGQQEDGTVDVLACLQKKVADDGLLNPLALTYAFQCVFLWATTPPTAMIPELVGTQTKEWNDSSLGKIVNSFDLYSAITPDTSCDGIPIDLKFLRSPGAPAMPVIHFLSACDPPLKQPAFLVNLGLLLTVLIGGAFKVIRMIAEFIHGPKLAEDWDDVRLF